MIQEEYVRIKGIMKRIDRLRETLKLRETLRNDEIWAFNQWAILDQNFVPFIMPHIRRNEP